MLSGRPHVEAAALLAAHGFARPSAPYRPSIWTLFAMQPAPFALLERLDKTTRPVVFRDLDALAAHIHRARHGQGLDMQEIEDLHHQWRIEGGGVVNGVEVDPPEDVRDRGVQVWTTMIDGGRDRCLGFAWLNGGGLEQLKAALRRADARADQQARRRALLSDASQLESRRAYARLNAAGWPGPREAYVPLRTGNTKENAHV